MTDITERLAEAAHEAWMESKLQQGITSRNSEWGEDLMVPYGELSEQAKDLDRGTVRGVLAAAARVGLELRPSTSAERALERTEAYARGYSDSASKAEARVRTQVAAETLMAAHDELVKVAERLEAKGREPGGKVHLGTAAGVRLACFRLVELADKSARRYSGMTGAQQ